MTKPWKVFLTDSALADLDGILETTLEEFGTIQLQRYTNQIEDAIRALEKAGSSAPLLKRRPDIRPGLFSYPVAREGRASPHQLYLKIETSSEAPAITILRILHDKMDPGARF